MRSTNPASPEKFTVLTDEQQAVSKTQSLVNKIHSLQVCEFISSTYF